MTPDFGTPECFHERAVVLVTVPKGDGFEFAAMDLILAVGAGLCAAGMTSLVWACMR